MTEKNLHGREGSENFAQTVKYRYNIRGWLTRINNPDSLGSDLFAQENHYEQKISSLPSTPAYNGNISAITWNTQHLSGTRAYAYTYDSLNRLRQAQYANPGGGSEDFSVPLLRYDLNGNITAVERHGAVDTARYGPVDVLDYTYDGNRLMALDDKVEQSLFGRDFSDHGSKRSDFDTLPDTAMITTAI